ncbi:MAG: citrate/2-methylcitrate synthase [Candidatus Omnitrophica bacterium]|nr:citrate/2-methylcitrate synthase [Candidatus Omnitrophota bacterium]
MKKLHEKTKKITELVLKAAERARNETKSEPEPLFAKPIQWPVNCIVGPGLEGAIACESKIGYVNGSKGQLIYRGYDIFDLCAYSSYEEVAYLLLHGNLPGSKQLKAFKQDLIHCRKVPNILRTLVSFPIESMNPMGTLRLASNLMRQEFTDIDEDSHKLDVEGIIGTDEDSIPMETKPKGEQHAIYEFKYKKQKKPGLKPSLGVESAVGYRSCYRLIAGLSTVAASIARLRQGNFPLEPNPELDHAANLLYMMTGKIPDPEQERIMDIILILHADHGMNASTFASMVVASTLSDIYFSIGSGIAALNGPLHGGANEQVVKMLEEIAEPANVKNWFTKTCREKRKIMGFGHRVYKAYDPRARVLRPLAEYLSKKNQSSQKMFLIAQQLEDEVIKTLGEEKKVFPNVDFYSGIVYNALSIPVDLYTPLFAVSRVAGWTARVMEYLQNNRIFRPRAVYIGPFNKKYPSKSKTA